MLKSNKIVIPIIGFAIISGAITSWYFGYYKPHKAKIETCENLAIGGFINAFGDLDSVYEICKNQQLQELYAETKRREGVEGASLEAHQKVYALCECAARELSKNIITGWVNKCVSGDEQWIDEAINTKARISKEPESILVLLGFGYKLCEKDR